MGKQKSNQVLFVGAMESELRPLIAGFRAKRLEKLLEVYPLYRALHKGKWVFIIETFVGDVNASEAVLAAILKVDPDLVIKFGCVGGSYPESQKGDVVIPLGYFDRTAWITRTADGKPVADASQWQSVFGELPHQVNSGNLGGLPYYFSVDDKYVQKSLSILRELRMKSVTAYVGGGNIWAFDQCFLNQMSKILLPHTTKHHRFVSDMESYSIAHAAYVTDKPHFGCYVVASNDYLDEPYEPDQVPIQMARLVPYAVKLVEEI